MKKKQSERNRDSERERERGQSGTENMEEREEKKEKNGPGKFDGISSWQISMGEERATCVRVDVGSKLGPDSECGSGQLHPCIPPGVWPGAAAQRARIQCTCSLGTRSYVTAAADRHASNLN